MAEVLDRRVALEEAFDSAEADAKGETYVPPAHDEVPANEIQAAETEEKDPAQVELEASNRPKEKVRTKGVPLSERGKPPSTSVEGEAPADPAAAKGPSLDKAPLGWGPTRDSLWAKVPTDVRAAISKREHEIQQGMSQAGRIRQVADEYMSVIQPFQNVIRSMGSTPKAAITDVMQTATTMIVGSQEQKIAVMCELVDRYGVDLQLLDTALVKYLEGKGQHRPPQGTLAPIDPRLMEQFQPLFAMQERLTQAEQQKEQTMRNEAAAAIASVENEPFFNDVRDDIADVMEIAAKRGVIMNIKQAYDKACQLNPEVAKLLPKARPTPADAVARARRAASTVRGAPGGAVLSGKTDRRAQLEAAWDSQ